MLQGSGRIQSNIKVYSLRLALSSLSFSSTYGLNTPSGMHTWVTWTRYKERYVL